MLINPNEINKVLSVTGNEITKHGKKYFEQSKVKIAEMQYVSDTIFEAKSRVEGTMLHTVTIQKKNGELSFTCDCKTAHQILTPCKHVIAMLFDLYINGESYLEFYTKKKSEEIENPSISQSSDHMIASETFSQNEVISYYEKLEMNPNYHAVDGTIQIVPKLEIGGLNDSVLSVSFKIGDKKLYLLKDIYEFSQMMQQEMVAKYGKDLNFEHVISSFTQETKPLAKFIAAYGQKYFEFNELASYGFTLNKAYKNRILLKNATLDQFFEIMQDKKIALEDEENKDLTCISMIEFISQDPEFEFQVIEGDNIGLNIMNAIRDYHIYQGQEYLYLLQGNKLYRCSDDFKKQVYPLLREFAKKKTDCIKIPKEGATSFCEYLIPNITTKAKVAIETEILERHRAEKLGTKIYLDVDEKSNIIAKVKFCYKETEFNPFDETKKVVCNRNMIAETAAKSLLKQYNFRINLKKGMIYLTNEDDIYTFLTEGIPYFMQKFEVLVTDKLKNRQIINTKSLNMGVRLKNNLLELQMEGLSLTELELKEIFRRYQLKKKYFRLKDGSFLNLDSAGIETLSNIRENLGVSEKEMASNTIHFPKYRALYLETLLKQNVNITVEKDSGFKEIIHDMHEISNSSDMVPESLETILRPYQKTGYSWLKTLEKYHFGGILADDMGLGKTIQIISVLISEVERCQQCHIPNTTSLVVCPSSLYINWEKEIRKFAPDMKILVVSGGASEREKLIGEITKYDVVITSYDLLKRDIACYGDFCFQYAIADEAQYIKNNNTKNARALKKIKANTRFALTGTPIENSLSELWSIFDFVMPGYLFSYQHFKNEYENPIVKDEDVLMLEKLQKMVAPFVLRRIKKEVLKELPDKTESIMYSKMEAEQEKLYQTYLDKAKQEMKLEFEANGFEKSRMKILALITRLRQLCCHPALFVENYTGGSAKLTQCMQIVEDAIASGHKILLFSGFTSMFEIIAKELEERGIEYSMLTGKTKVDTRVAMVEEFNNSKEVKVFLISLKAGGTGLNLTGADMVIHYDPWWNLSAQNQATDRAYRIGQKSNVQVFKLISQHTIEEKILTLQDRKIELTNSIIHEKETFISKMNQSEILDLFDMK